MDELAESITKKLVESNIGLPRWEIERIVQETVEQLREEETKGGDK